jgi:hypothetical protein
MAMAAAPLGYRMRLCSAVTAHIKGALEVVAGAPGGMTEAAAEAVRRWVYQPARVGDRPVAVWKTVRVHFAIHPKEARGEEKPPL